MYLEIKQLTKHYNARSVVSAVDLPMEEGEILSLLGPSGCGKTTILRMIAGLIKPDGGYIRVGDQVFFDGSREIPAENRQLGMVFQDFALWPHMTVIQNIGFGLRLRRQSANVIAKRVEELLELVNLSGFGNRYPYQLSGGQQQRVAVARALATAPRLLLLDEPFSSLDTGLRATMREELVQLFKRLKITAINVTHDQDEAMMMSDRVMVLRDGYVQQIGSPMDLYLEPENVFVASFIGQANFLSAQGLDEPIHNGNVVARVALAADTDAPAASPLVFTGYVSEKVSHRLNGRVKLMCRPDNISIHLEAPAGDMPNVLQGTIVYTSFVAGRWQTMIHVPGHLQEILAYTAVKPDLNQPIWLELPPQTCRILPVERQVEHYAVSDRP